MKEIKHVPYKKSLKEYSTYECIYYLIKITKACFFQKKSLKACSFQKKSLNHGMDNCFMEFNQLQ